jgi:hypothetical protein
MMNPTTMLYLLWFLPQIFSTSTFIPTNAPTSTPKPTMAPTPHWTVENIFSFTGSDIVMTIPEGIPNITVNMWGAGGGNYNTLGGAGAYVEGVLQVTPGQRLTIMVGQGGDRDAVDNYGFGGDYGGGGMSALLLDGEYVVIAGGGGGSGFTERPGGAATSYSNGEIQTTGFQGGWDSVQSTSCGSSGNGGGGSQTTAGCGGEGSKACCDMNNGAQYQGGTGGNGGNGGGGGAGYFGAYSAY